jgi:hypothetical protein
MYAKQNLEMIGMTPLSSIAMSAYTDLVRRLVNRHAKVTHLGGL